MNMPKCNLTKQHHNFPISISVLREYAFLWVLIPSLIISSCSKDDPITNQKENIVIGGMAALSGDASIYGRIDKLVSDMIFAEINSNGGINGRHIEVIWYDTECDPVLAKETAAKLINDGMAIILGASCSGSTLAASETTEENEVILFTSIATSKDIKVAGDFVFRVAASDETSGAVLGEYANEKFSKVGILTEQTSYALGITKKFLEVYTGTSVASSFPSTQTNFELLVGQLQSENVDAILIMPQTPVKSRSILDELIKIGWDKDVFGNEMLFIDNQMVLDFSSEYVTWNCVSANFVPPASSALDDFKLKFESKFGEELTLLGYAATAVDRNNILKQVLQEVDDEKNTKAIRDALYAIKNHEGLSGNFSFDSFGEVDLVHSLLTFDGTTFIPVID